MFRRPALLVVVLLSLGSIPLCVEAANSVTVESVRFRTADHLTVRQFAVRTAGREQLGGSDRGIAAEGFDPARHTVATRCSGAEHSELGIDVTAGAPLAHGSTLEIGYRLGYRPLSTDFDLDLAMCYSAERCPTS